MANVVNPRVGIFVDGLDSGIWDSSDELVEPDIEIDVTKDLDDEPNECTVVVHNANQQTRELLCSKQGALVTVSFANHGSSELIPCYIGEIEMAKSVPSFPGHSVEMQLKSQVHHARDKYFNETYIENTSLKLIIDDLVDAIGLPLKSVILSTTTKTTENITLTGPAFELLKFVVKEWSRADGIAAFTYICDGKLYISSFWEPPKSTVINITDAMLLTVPDPTVNSRASEVWFKVSSLDQYLFTSNFAVKAAAKQTISAEKLKVSEELGATDIVYTEKKGVSFEMIGMPDLQPDMVIKLKDRGEQLYRIISLSHSGDQNDGIVTAVEADVFEGRA